MLYIRSSDNRVCIWKGSLDAFRFFRGGLATLFGLTIYAYSFDYYRKPRDWKRNSSYYDDVCRAEWDQANQQRPELIDFFLHSDCEGEWSVDECKSVANILKDALGDTRLQRLRYNREIQNWTVMIEDFIDGLYYCMNKRQNALFSIDYSN